MPAVEFVYLWNVICVTSLAEACYMRENFDRCTISGAVGTGVCVTSGVEACYLVG